MAWKTMFPVICIIAYPLLALLVRAIIGLSGSSSDVTGAAMGAGIGMLWLTAVLWAVWFVMSLFLSHRVMGTAWWALLYLAGGIVATFVLGKLFSILRALWMMNF